ncbi:MAG: hypothetical protein ACI867_002054, partial [Glaciecola sp.]
MHGGQEMPAEIAIDNFVSRRGDERGFVVLSEIHALVTADIDADVLIERAVRTA